MSSAFEKSVKGATKIKLAAPKSKYIEHILQATHTGEAGVAEIFRTLTFRLRDSTWTIVFKALIVIHLMIREGSPQATLSFIVESPSKMAIGGFTDAQVQGGNIRRYHNYLLSRAKAFQSTKQDWVRDGQGRLSKQSIDKGLLRETETVQKQLSPLLKCDLFSNDSENEISLTAFRLLVLDLMALFKVMNEGMVNILEHYFEMSKPDAERALSIYQTFIKQTDQVVKFLHVARQYEGSTRLEIPTLKHAPTTLLSPLQEYLNDPDFEINRRQYLAQRDGKALPTKMDTSSKPNAASSGASSTSQAAQASKPMPKAPAPDLIDFFSSIEQNQQPLQSQPQQAGAPFNFQQQPVAQSQPIGFASTNPFAQMAAAEHQPQPPAQPLVFNQQQPFSVGLQSIPQDQPISFQQQQQQQVFQNEQQQFTGIQQQPQYSGQQQNFGVQQPTFTPNQQPQLQQLGNQQPYGIAQQNTGMQQSTNPFRQSMMPAATGASSSPFNNSSPFNSPPPQPQSHQSTNPFARNLMSQDSGAGSSPFLSSPPNNINPAFIPQATTSAPPAQPLQSTKTGTNPFARSTPVSTLTSPIVAQPTGTNPFRQSAFVNQQTGHSWQAQQGTMGGLEQLNTIPVFPRPAGQQQQQQPWS